MSYTVKAGSTPVFSLAETDTAKSVLQNLALLYATKQGTVPQYREFGLPMEFIDRPIDVAKSLAIAEITEATETFEPRAKISNISFEIDAVNGRLIPIVEVQISE